MDLRALADQTGLSMSTISRLERGKSQVTIRTALRLCEGLQVSLAVLARAFLETIAPELQAARGSESWGVVTKASASSDLFSHLEASALWDNASEGGGVMSENVGAYLRHLRRTGSLTLQQLQHAVGIPFTALGRLEQGLIGQVKLATAIALDRQWRQEGRVLALFWSVARQAPVTEARTE